MPAHSRPVTSRPVIQVLSAPPPLRFDHDHSTAEITALRRVRAPNVGQHCAGLTDAESELRTDYQMGSSRRSDSRVYRIWVDSVSVVFDYTRMDVYLSNQYGVGSCEYNVILAHEKRHVAIDERELLKYKDLMARALRHSRSIPGRAHSLRVRSLEAGKAILTRRIRAIVMPYLAKYKRALAIENGKIDTPANYRRTQALCNGW